MRFFLAFLIGVTLLQQCHIIRLKEEVATCGIRATMQLREIIHSVNESIQVDKDYTTMKKLNRK
jgi:hypothetical protein